MSSKKRIPMIIISSFIIAIVLTPFIYVQVNKVVYKNKVMKYLIEEKGYQQEEIKSVEGVWGMKLPPFYSVVVFENESYVEYIYFAHNEIMQFEYRLTDERKQQGISEKDLLNYEPLN
jgi:hypothetical protein